MSVGKAGASLRSLALTPDRIPHFLIPSSGRRSPLLFRSPRDRRDSPDRTRLLSDDSAGGSSGASPENRQDPENRRSPVPPVPSRFLRLPTPVPVMRLGRHRGGTAGLDADTDLTTRAAMSLPYGFRAVLAASPCTRRRESLFHRNKPVTVKVTDGDSTYRSDPAEPGGPAEAPPPGAERVCLGPVKALGLQVAKELKKPLNALKALSPAGRRAEPRV